MLTQSSAVQTLLAENAKLRNRPDEAEEILRAIRGGEADALLAESSAGLRIFALQGQETGPNHFRGEIFAQINDAVIVFDDDRHIIYINTAAAQQYGLTASEAYGRCVTELFRHHWLHPGDEAMMMAALCETGRWQGETIHVKRNGEAIWVESSVSRLHAGSATHSGLLLALNRDITEHKLAEENLRRLNRTLHALSRSGRALIHATDETAYLQEICRIIVEDCGHAMVWVGFAEQDEAKTVRPVASAGFEEGYLDLLHISWADTERGSGPTGMAIRTGQVCQCRNMLTDPQFVPWPAETVKRGYSSSAVFPLQADGRVFGALALYSQEPAGFADAEVQLLTELADNFAYGITTLRLRAAHTESERSLRESEQRMRLASEATSVGIWEWNIITNRISWDAQMFRIYGFAPTANEFIQYSTWREAVLPEDLFRQEEVMQETIRQRGHSTREFRILRADDGECRHIQAVETVRTNAGGQVEWLVGTNLDITEYKQAEEYLKKSSAQLKTFINHSPISMAMFDRNMDYLATSGRWLDDYGRGYADLIGRNHYRVHPDMPDQWKAIHQQGLAGFTLKNDEDLWIRKDGKKHWLRWAVVPWMDEKDAIGGIIISSEDITDHKLYEAQLAEQAQQLRENDRRKDEFLAMLAHELRNPLAPIRNAVEIQKHANMDPSRITWCTDMIDRQIRHLTGLVDDLLDVSRISRGLVELKKETLEIRDFIQPAVETNQPLIDARRQKFNLALPSEPLWIEGDRIRLAQVMSNLINNAAKYSREGDWIGLTAESSDDNICIRVTDNGCGIDPAELPSLFDLFYQADRNLDRSQGGLGIGLSLVRRLVEKHGGDVRAFSVGPGQGSEFTVRLPKLIFPEPAAACASALSAPNCGKLRILVVDDNRDAAESLALLLELEGHLVHTANDGPAALEMARAERADVILLDIGLPGMDGYSVAQALRLCSELERPLLIALTGYGQLEDREKSFAAGFDEHLVKPIDYETLRKSLINYHADKCKIVC